MFSWILKALQCRYVIGTLNSCSMYVYFRPYCMQVFHTLMYVYEEKLAHCLYLPTTMSSLSDACRLMRSQMSIVKRVLLLLNIEVREDMRAAIITAIIRPRIPAGKKKQCTIYYTEHVDLTLFRSKMT